MAKLTELAKLFEQIGRLHLKAGKLLHEVEVEPLLEGPEEKKARVPMRVVQVWEKYTEARAHHLRQKHGLNKDHAVVPIKLTSKRVKLINDAIQRHGVDRCKRAAIGLFLSEFHAGKNEHGKEYLEPERPFQIKAGKDMVDFFAGIYQEHHNEF